MLYFFGRKCEKAIPFFYFSTKPKILYVNKNSEKIKVWNNYWIGLSTLTIKQPPDISFCTTNTDRVLTRHGLKCMDRREVTIQEGGGGIEPWREEGNGWYVGGKIQGEEGGKGKKQGPWGGRRSHGKGQNFAPSASPHLYWYVQSANMFCTFSIITNTAQMVLFSSEPSHLQVYLACYFFFS